VFVLATFLKQEANLAGLVCSQLVKLCRHVTGSTTEFDNKVEKRGCLP
jgi:hypothetical protein